MGKLAKRLQDILNEQDFCFDPEEMRAVERALGYLAAYEDTGLEPEEIGAAQKAMRSALALACEAQAYRALGTVEELSALVKARDEGPCGLCRYNPPSSCDGKPCTMCPAEAALEAQDG